jgi:hypothetical protein
LISFKGNLEPYSSSILFTTPIRELAHSQDFVPDSIKEFLVTWFSFNTEISPIA